MRLKIFRIIIIILFLGITAGLVYTQVMCGFDYFTQSQNNIIRVVPIDGKRGLILDRNGVVLADNRMSFDVMVVPQELKDKDSLFTYLSKILGIEKDKLLKIYRSRVLASFAPVVVAKDVKRETAIVLEENKFRFPGLMVHAGFKRYYPFIDVDAHILGYVGKINRSRITQLKDYGYTIQNTVGYSGIEEFYDSFLRGEDGGLQIEVDNRGKQVRLLGYKESVMGENITLTIDNRIQKMAMDALEGRKGSVVVMNMETGEILGMVNYPSFDPNAFVEGRQEISAYFNDSAAPLLNRAISGQYPPGSTFKIPVAIGALESHKINPGTSFTCPGYYMLGRRQFSCSHTHGVQNFNEGLAHSCNVYFFNTGLLEGPELIVKYARLLGLGDLTNIDLPYEAKGLIPDKPIRRTGRDQKWHTGDILNVSIGQGDILATPMQLVRMMASIARNGEEIDPYVLKSVGAADVQRHPASKHLDVSQQTLDIVRTGLRAAVGDYAGTAHILDIKDMPISGKTGTAQTSGGKAHHAWFVGFSPNTKTKIVFCVFLEHGGSSYNACFVARNLLLRMKEEEIL